MKTDLIDVIKDIAKCSRVFPELPIEQKPSIRDQFELIEDSLRAVGAEMRRLENRMAILRYEIEKTAEVGK